MKCHFMFQESSYVLIMWIIFAQLYKKKKEIFSVAVKTAEYGYSTTLSGLN